MLTLPLKAPDWHTGEVRVYNESLWLVEIGLDSYTDDDLREDAEWLGHERGPHVVRPPSDGGVTPNVPHEGTGGTLSYTEASQRWAAANCGPRCYRCGRTAKPRQRQAARRAEQAQEGEEL